MTSIPSLPCKWEYFSRNLYKLSVHTITNIKPLWNPSLRFVIQKKSFLQLWRYLLYILNECLLSINPFYDTSQVLIMIWSSVHRIMTINFIGCVITLVIPSSLAMFSSKKNLSEILFALFSWSLTEPSPPKKKVCKSQIHFYTTYVM